MFVGKCPALTHSLKLTTAGTVIFILQLV